MPGAILIGILLTAAFGLPLGLTELHGVISTPPSLTPTLLKLDVPARFRWGSRTSC